VAAQPGRSRPHALTRGSGFARARRAGRPAGRILFIGTATTLIQAAGFTILTDPNFLHRSQRAYVGMGLSTRRLTEPALSIGELPPLDFVVRRRCGGSFRARCLPCA
jgi:hypothetical protein